MSFDARTIKLLETGAHLTSPDHPGLRIEARDRLRTWTYRYRSSIDGKVRQLKLGRWPAMSVHAAIVEWERLRKARDAGEDPALAIKQGREQAKEEIAREQDNAARDAYTVARVCDDYYQGHVRLARARKGAVEIRRMFDTMLGDTGNIPAHELTRAQAFDLIRSFAESAPVQAQSLRSELGAAWDYAIDSGRLPETAPNWWRLILRGKIKSHGKRIAGERVGTAKRVLSADEVGHLIRWLPNFSATVEDVLTLYLWTGTRGAEICAMRGDEVGRELDGQLWWVIPKVKTKNARHANASDLRVPLFGRALNVVLRRKERFGNSFLFPARTKEVKPIDQKVAGVAVYHHQPYSATAPHETRARLTVTHWAPHDLRRTVRTTLSALGCPQEVAEAIIGHMPPGIAGVYNLHDFDAERLEWLRRLADHWEGLAVR